MDKTIKRQRKRVVTRLLNDGDRYPWAVLVDGEIAHRFGNRASAWAWAERERERIDRQCHCLGGSTHATDDPSVRRCDLCGGIVPTDPKTGEFATRQSPRLGRGQLEP